MDDRGSRVEHRQDVGDVLVGRDRDVWIRGLGRAAVDRGFDDDELVDSGHGVPSL